MRRFLEDGKARQRRRRALDAAAEADEDTWQTAEAFNSVVCETVVDGERYIVAFFTSHGTRDATRMAQQVAATGAKLLIVEARVAPR